MYIGVDELTANCRAGLAAKEKLRKVVQWAKGAGSTFRNIKLHSDQVFLFANIFIIMQSLHSFLPVCYFEH